MKHLAIFVEGFTEAVFVEKTIKEVAADKNIVMELFRGVGPITGRSYRYVRGSTLNSGADFFVIIYNSGGDGTVNADIKDRYKSLARSGCEAIIAIKDVYPNTRADIAKLMYYFGYRVPTIPISTTYILSIMEIEAWFIAEHTHFSKVHPTLTCDLIKKTTGFDPSVDDPQVIHHPAADLDSYYQLVGKRYDKDVASINDPDNLFSQVPDLLDYATLYLDTINRIEPLKSLMQCIDSFFSTN